MKLLSEAGHKMVTAYKDREADAVESRMNGAGNRVRTGDLNLGKNGHFNLLPAPRGLWGKPTLTGVSLRHRWNAGLNFASAHFGPRPSPDGSGLIGSTRRCAL